MLLNSNQILNHLVTNGKGERQQVGYDLTIHAIKKIHGGVITQDKTDPQPYDVILPGMGPTGKLMYSLSQGVYSLTFDQGIKLPSDRTAFIVHRSSVVRCGSFITSGIFDPGFETEQLGAVLFVVAPLSIEKGARVAQLFVHENYEAELYAGQWQGQKDRK